MWCHLLGVLGGVGVLQAGQELALHPGGVVVAVGDEDVLLLVPATLQVTLYPAPVTSHLSSSSSLTRKRPQRCENTNTRMRSR